MGQSPLGIEHPYPDQYAPSLLFPVNRNEYRSRIPRVDNQSSGEDIWNCYELSWLNTDGVPQLGIAQIIVPTTSSSIVESKSLKLYLGGFAGTKFLDSKAVAERVQNDLATRLNSNDLTVDINLPHTWVQQSIVAPPGECIDHLPKSCSRYTYAPELLTAAETCSLQAEFIVHSQLLRSLCPVTGQPDWGTVVIGARGGEWNLTAVAEYLISFRNHTGFHEACCETIFGDLSHYCKPNELAVSCHFTRRGGIDINPVRRSSASAPKVTLGQNARLARQ
jgi:7-cyano-7-deazaguanine reductase